MISSTADLIDFVAARNVSPGFETSVAARGIKRRLFSQATKRRSGRLLIFGAQEKRRI